MTEATKEFFQEVCGAWARIGAGEGHGPAPLRPLGRRRARTRWLLTIRKGDVAVSRRNAKADCVVRRDRTLFDGIASGEAVPTSYAHSRPDVPDPVFWQAGGPRSARNPRR
jgi:hypothetical protein